MGQYFKIVNVDKRESIHPFLVDDCQKLMEWSYSRGESVLAMLDKMATDWKGDRVYVVGDYARANDPGEKCYNALKELTEEFQLDDISLYDYADENFKNISAKCDTENKGYRYIYSHATRQVIDLTKCPVEWVWYNEETKVGSINHVAPLPLLLAMGNDRGAGDFHEGNHGYEYVGSWCDSVKDIEIRKDPIPGNDYEEFDPDFTENKPLIPYTEGPEMLKKEIERKKGRDDEALHVLY